MDDFAAIDFETANSERSSVCSVGLVVVRGGVVTDTFYSLIQPEPNYYSYWCSRVHGLCSDDTDDAPLFPEVWEQVDRRLRLEPGEMWMSECRRLPLVAHNKAFDEGCLKAVFRVYQIDYPDYVFFDTLRAARRRFPWLSNHKLDTVSACCGYNLSHHHHALADAEACAAIALKIL